MERCCGIIVQIPGPRFRLCTDNSMISNVKKSHNKKESCNNNKGDDDKPKFQEVTDDVRTRQLRLALDQCNVSYAIEGEDLDLVQAFDSSVSKGFVCFFLFF